MADNQEKSLTLSQSEIVALKKTIMYLKFYCEEIESVMYVGSPLINSIFSKLIEIDGLGQQSIDFYNKGHAENERFVWAKLDKLELENGREFQNEGKGREGKGREVLLGNAFFHSQESNFCIEN